MKTTQINFDDYLAVVGGEERDGSLTVALRGCVSRERKALVVTGAAAAAAVVDDDDGAALFDRCNQRDASVSGVGLFMKMSNSGTQDSIFAPFSALLGRKVDKAGVSLRENF